MNISGYAGNILHIDLTFGKTRKEELDPTLVTEFIGGFGINNKLAYDLIPPDADPYSPENAIIIGAGAFAGTPVIASSQVMVTTKFPINGAFGTACGGGRFAHMLKWSGYDHVVIRGQGKKPVYIRIIDDEVEFCDATDLWGKDNYETIDELRRRHEPCSIIPISQAGETLGKISVTFVDGYGNLGNGGLPAVMASKNLKAIVVQQGTRSIRVADRNKFMDLVNGWFKKMVAWPGRGGQLQRGTSVPDIQSPFNITQYHTEVQTWLDDEQRAIFQQQHDRDRRGISCASCVFRCKETLKISVGKFAGTLAHHHHYTGGRFDYKDGIEAYGGVTKICEMLNRYGICFLSFQDMLDFTARLYEKGTITKQDTGGLEIKQDLETALKLIPMIARREGFGDLLADGTLEAARRIDRGVEKYVAHCKGRPTIYDPRLMGLGPMIFEQVVSPRGAHSCTALFIDFLPGRALGILQNNAKRMGMPADAINRCLSPPLINPGIAAKWGEDWCIVCDLFGVCLQPYIHRFYGVGDLAELYSALTGIEIDTTRLMKIAERSWDVYKFLNVRAGFSRKDDVFPEMWFTPLKGLGQELPLQDYLRTTVLTRSDLEGYLDDYYTERGYDKQTGIPSPEKLKELGLEGI